MKRINLIIAALLIAGLALALPATAAESAPHQSHKGMQMNHGAMKGKLIRQTRINGYTLTYHLYDMKTLMPNTPNMTNTYHLMLTLADSKGTTVDKAVVGYLVKGPDGNVEKVMAMAMGDGFGANIRMPAAGIYTIKAKAVVDGKKLIDAFTYDKTK